MTTQNQNPSQPDHTSNVIDLQAAREMRGQPTEVHPALLEADNRGTIDMSEEDLALQYFRSRAAVHDNPRPAETPKEVVERFKFVQAAMKPYNQKPRR